jgi:hypothetical protein
MQTMHYTPLKESNPSIRYSRSEEKIEEQRCQIRELKRSHAEALKKKEKVWQFH